MTELKRRYMHCLALAAFVLGLDQASKQAVLDHLRPGELLPVIPGYFNLTLAFNRGALFGFLNDSDINWQRGLFIAAAFAAMGVILYLIRQLRPDDALGKIGLGLLLGGAAGNLVDRILIGRVVDFLDFYIGSAHWPAFNAADCGVSVGVALLLISLIRQPLGDKAQEG